MTSKFELLDSIAESMAVINSSGAILFTNKAWRSFSDENRGDDSCTGINNNYIAVCNAVEGDESEMAKNAKNGIQRVIDRELEIFELEYPCHSPDKKRWFILRASPDLSDPNLTLLAHIDITNRKLSELENEKNYMRSVIVNERLNATLFRIVHDIQDPLTGIMGLVDLSKSEQDIEVLNEYIEMIDEGSSNLSQFIKDTLRYISTFEDLQPIDVELMVAQHLETVKSVLDFKSIRLIIDINQNNEFYTNAVEFRSVLSNLISNAIKYSDEAKREKVIKLKCTVDDAGLILQIQDNGIGIKKEDIPKLTQRKFQVKENSSPGAGLGLFMVQKSITVLGGTLKILSNYGEGSTFIVKIPHDHSSAIL